MMVRETAAVTWPVVVADWFFQGAEPQEPAGRRLYSEEKRWPALGPVTPAEKVALFRSLFRGRVDVFPKLWVNPKAEKKGYAPACSNEWERGICDKPRIKCGECKNQAFIPVTEQVVIDHLKGKHVIGVYPMLPDDTCWFLAADFDKSSWREDVQAFVETCREAKIPAAVERSRSGNGAHVWFFFASPVGAGVARKMGCYLLTQTMSRRHELSMKSYDRLFPNQDTMPKGGFGNLIALPLQHGPRQAGNSVFVDDRLAEYPSQWEFLASIQRMTPAAVEEIAEEASRRGQVIGVRLDTEEGDETLPWERRPSKRPRTVPITGTLPERVRVVSAERLYVEKAGLSSPVLNQIKRLAALQNPKFYELQNMRRSTAKTPRVIQSAEDLPAYVGLPRGCGEGLAELLGEYGSTADISDERQRGMAVDFRFQGELTAVQREAVEALLANDIGMFVAPPGTGKTVVGTYLVAKRACSTLVLVHRRLLMDQWVTQLAFFLGIEPSEIGQIGGGKDKATGKLDVAMLQSLIRKREVDDRIAEYGHVIVDECHHVPAVCFTRVLTEAKARFVLGLTATPQRRDGLQRIGQMQLGPIRFVIGAHQQAAARPFVQRLVVRETAFGGAGLGAEAGIQTLYAALARDEVRNRLILDDVVAALREGRSPILLTERKDHLEYLERNLTGLVRHLVVLRGGMGAKEHRRFAPGRVVEQLAAIPAGEERLLLATGRYIGEGFDDGRLDTLLLAMPVSWKGTLVQYAGRLHRLHPGKSEVRIIDYVDRKVPVLMRMFEKRLRGYRAIGYARGEAPLGLAEKDEEVEIAADEGQGSFQMADE